MGAGRFCNIYTFSSANPDLLSFDAPFTGNIKLIVKSTATTGIHPDILAGLQGTFIPDEWTQYEADVTGIGNIVDATFNGVVGRFALDDVWYAVDMGAPDDVRAAFYFNGVNQYGEIQSPTPLEVGDTIDIVFRVDSDEFARVLRTTNGSGYLQVYPTAQSPAFRLHDGTAFLGLITDPDYPTYIGVGYIHLNMVRVSGGYQFTRTIDGNTRYLGQINGARSVEFKRVMGDGAAGSMLLLKIKQESWAIDSFGLAIQPSTPSGNPITIINHDPANWGYINV